MSSQREAYQLPNQRSSEPSQTQNQSQDQSQAQPQSQSGAYTPSYGGAGTTTGTATGTGAANAFGFGNTAGAGAGGNDNATGVGMVNIMGPGLNRAQDVTYICGECAAKVALNLGDAIRCKECGHRVLYKERTKRIVQFEAR